MSSVPELENMFGVAESCAGESFPAGVSDTGVSNWLSPSDPTENDALGELGMYPWL